MKQMFKNGKRLKEKKKKKREKETEIKDRRGQRKIDKKREDR